jgi:hypothetical protein
MEILNPISPLSISTDGWMWRLGELSLAGCSIWWTADQGLRPEMNSFVLYKHTLMQSAAKTNLCIALARHEFEVANKELFTLVVKRLRKGS